MTHTVDITKFEKQLKDAIEVLWKEEIRGVERISPVSEIEIEKLERLFGAKLPAVYKTFLRVCGKETSSALGCTGIEEYSSLLEMPELIEELTEAGDLLYPFPKEAFIFESYLGEQFWLFLCNGEDNPRVYKRYDDKPNMYDTRRHLAEWLLDSVRSVPDIKKRQKETDERLRTLFAKKQQQKNDSEGH